MRIQMQLRPLALVFSDWREHKKAIAVQDCGGSLGQLPINSSLFSKPVKVLKLQL